MKMRGSDIKSKMQTYVDSADRSKRDVEANLHKIQAEMSEITSRKLRLMDTIASTQLEAIVGGEDVRDATGSIEQTLKLREMDYAKLQVQMDEARERLKQAELELATNGSMLNNKRAAAFKEMSDSEEIATLQTRQGDLAREIAHLTNLLDLTQDECREKLKAFDADPAFMHLFKRQFGTNSYKGMAFGKALDAWLAKKIDYSQSAHDYDILQKLPVMAEARLDQKVTERRDVVSAAKSLETEIMRRHGVIEADDRMQKAQARLSVRRDAIADIQNQINKHINGSDPRMLGIKDQMTESLKRLSIPTLERMTKATKSTRDEHALEEYKSITEREDRLKIQEQQLRIRLRETSDTFRRAKEMRDHFVKQSYDSNNRTFRDSFDVASVINGYIAGTLTQSDIDSRVRNGSTYKAPEEYRPSSTWSSDSSSSSSSSSGSSSWSTSDSMSGGSDWSTGDRF